MVKTVLPMQGARVRSLVGELRSRMTHGAAKTKAPKQLREPYSLEFEHRLLRGEREAKI